MTHFTGLYIIVTQFTDQINIRLSCMHDPVQDCISYAKSCMTQCTGLDLALIKMYDSVHGPKYNCDPVHGPNIHRYFMYDSVDEPVLPMPNHVGLSSRACMKL